jgi:hypothetical protein
MNYYGVRQLVKGGYHYTCRNDSTIWPAAGCRDHLDQPHETEAAARRCAANWVVENATYDVTLDVEHNVPRCALPECKALVNVDGKPNGASYGVGMKHFVPLCEDHLNMAGVRVLVGDDLGTVISS